MKWIELLISAAMLLNAITAEDPAIAGFSFFVSGFAAGIAFVMWDAERDAPCPFDL